MTNFEKKDIKPLNFIVSQSLFKHNVTTEDLIKEGLIAKNNDNGFELDLAYSPVSEFVRYMHILTEFGVCDCNYDEDCESARKNSKTLHFQKQGGFKKIFTDLIAESKLIKQKSDLEISNLEIQKETLEYQKSIRDKEAQIRNLTTDNLRLGNWDIRFRWLIAFLTFVIGFIVKYFINKW